MVATICILKDGLHLFETLSDSRTFFLQKAFRCETDKDVSKFPKVEKLES